MWLPTIYTKTILFNSLVFLPINVNSTGKFDVRMDKKNCRY